jgi:glycoside/pentoside/hexuronide:cation symporter, GPH family
LQKSAAPAPASTEQRLPWGTVFGFGQLAVPLAFAGLPIAVFVSKFYAEDLKINIETVGLILLVARLADFLVDPIIGYASDRTTWSLGRRRTWVLLGAPVFMLGIYMLFLPPADATETHLLIWIAVFYLGWTMITIPYGAWGAELSGDYNERSRITGVREIFTLVGLALAGVIPVIVGTGAAAGALNGGGYWQAMEVLGWTIIALTPIGVAIMFWSTPEPAYGEAKHVSVWKGAQAALSNMPFLRLFCATAAVRIASRAAEVLFLFYLVDAVGLSKAEGNHFPLALIVSAIVFAPLWIWAGGAITKHRALSLAMLTAVGVFIALPFFQGAGYLPNMILFAILGAAFSAPYTLGQSIAADVVDLDSLKTHEPRAGLIISFFGLAIKGGDAVGAGFALMLVGFLGFDSAATVKSPEAIDSLTLVFAALPIVFYLPAVALLWSFPITPQVQARIRRLVERRVLRKLKREAKKTRALSIHMNLLARQTRK